VICWHPAVMNQLIPAEAEKAAPLSKQGVLLTEIRDILKSGQK
jgi:large-conductance mechanosensitive channel